MKREHRQDGWRQGVNFVGVEAHMQRQFTLGVSEKVKRIA